MTKIVTAAVVREYFRAEAKRLDRLSDAAKVSVAEGARGRLHPEAVKAFNRNRKHKYVPGNGKAVKAKRAAARAYLRDAGVEVGSRGRLSAAAKEMLAEAKV